MPTPEMDALAETTRRVTKGDGYKDYIPTLYFPDRAHLVTLVEVPPEEDHRIRQICLKWARQKAQGDEQFVVAMKETDNSFRIVHYRDGEFIDHVYPA